MQEVFLNIANSRLTFTGSHFWKTQKWNIMWSNQCRTITHGNPPTQKKKKVSAQQPAPHDLAELLLSGKTLELDCAVGNKRKSGRVSFPADVRHNLVEAKGEAYSVPSWLTKCLLFLSFCELRQIRWIFLSLRERSKVLLLGWCNNTCIMPNWSKIGPQRRTVNILSKLPSFQRLFYLTAPHWCLWSSAIPRILAVERKPYLLCHRFWDPSTACLCSLLQCLTRCS